MMLAGANQILKTCQSQRDCTPEPSNGVARTDPGARERKGGELVRLAQQRLLDGPVLRDFLGYCIEGLTQLDFCGMENKVRLLNPRREPCLGWV